MTISASDASRLREAGFIEEEIMAIANAKTATGGDQPPVKLDSPVWQAVMESRREWWIDKVERGWKEYEIVNEMQNYYRRDNKRNPYDFIKAEYKPPKKADYMEIVRKRHANEINRELKGYNL